MKCSVAECARAAERRGWCFPHYKRWRRHGDPLAGLRRFVGTPAERDGMQALHRCDNKPCCRADHLYEGSPSENTRDGWARGQRRR